MVYKCMFANIESVISNMFPTLLLLLVVAHAASTAHISHCEDLEKHKNFWLLPKGDECPDEQITPRIMGGKNADMGEFPWIVLILQHLRMDGHGLRPVDYFRDIPVCTGSIINSKYVITAAHCITSDFKDPLYDTVVRVGEYNLKTRVDCDNGFCAPPTITYMAEEYIQHPRYTDRSSDYDLGLIRVKGEMHWNDYVHPACLPLSCSLLKKGFEGERLEVAGFGMLEDNDKKDKGGKEAHILQKVRLHGVDPDICVESYSSHMSSTLIICAGDVRGGDLHKDVCHGDSGGPLIYHDYQDDEPPQPYVVGVVSGGLPCNSSATEQAPGIYTRLAPHMDWILDNIRE